jgi:hypothetical protein
MKAQSFDDSHAALSMLGDLFTVEGLVSGIIQPMISDFVVM